MLCLSPFSSPVALPFPHPALSCSTMLRSWTAFQPCWNWAPVWSALSLWQGSTMLWGCLEPQEGQSVQMMVWILALVQRVVAAPPGAKSSTHPQQTVKAGRSIVQDWSVARACFLGPTPSWSPQVSPPAMTLSTSHTCLALLHLYTRTASACLLMWPHRSKSEGECWGWKENWWSVPMWWRDVGVVWLSRGTLWKPTRLIRYKAHHRHDARSGSEYDSDLNSKPWLSLTYPLKRSGSFLHDCFSEWSETYRSHLLTTLITWRNRPPQYSCIQYQHLLIW